jgi:hypothetical protein
LGPSTGLFHVGERLVTPPIRWRAGELKLIGALMAAAAQHHPWARPACRRPRRRLTMTEVVSKIAAGETRIIGDQTFSFKGNITAENNGVNPEKSKEPVTTVMRSARRGGSSWRVLACCSAG